VDKDSWAVVLLNRKKAIVPKFFVQYRKSEVIHEWRGFDDPEAAKKWMSEKLASESAQHSVQSDGAKALVEMKLDNDKSVFLEDGTRFTPRR
jgi:hypothetical protein